MVRRRFNLWAVFAGALAWACGGDDPVDPPDEGPPDVSGTYSLESFSSAAATGNVALSPPDVSGTLTLVQSPSTGREATGTFDFDVTVPDSEGGTERVVDQGTYTIRADGTWEQRGGLFQGTGTFTIEGAVLTLTVNQPILSVSRSVWRRQ